MRTIKFRAITKKYNVMVFGDLIFTPSQEHRIIWFEQKGELPLDVDYNSFNEMVQSSTIGQFTGLVDIKGVEIYEGDICSKDDLNGVVKFDHGWYIEFSKSYSHDMPQYYCDKLQVIGNIFNKENNK